MNYGKDQTHGLTVKKKIIYMSQKVIVIGQGYTGRLSIIRSVAEMGCETTIIALLTHDIFEKNNKKQKPIDAYSKYVARTLFCENYNEQMLIDILLSQCADCQQKAFIFPDNDFSAAAVDRNRDKLKDFFYIPHIQQRQGSVGEWMDKTKQKELAAQIGLNVVDSVLLNVRDRSYILPENVNFPCFVKPLVSIVGGKSGLKRCDNKEALVEHINDFIISHHFNDVDFMIEDYKVINREFATLGFSDGVEVVIPGLLELLRIGHGSHFGVAIQGKVFPVDGYEEIVNLFKCFVSRVGFVGIFDIDFFESEGKQYFCEMNLRFGGSGYAFTKTGVNLPVMMIKSFRGESIEGMNKVITKSATYFNERMAVGDWSIGLLPLKELNKIRKESDIKFLESNVDPIPKIIFDMQFIIMRIRKIIKQCILKR